MAARRLESQETKGTRMNNLNPNAVVFVALCTGIAALFGSWLVGLVVGLAVVLLAEVVEGL